MTTQNSPGSAAEPVQHTDVAAYALGVLDAADAELFEEHLAGCDRCAVELESVTALTPFLAEHAWHGGPPPTPDGPPPELLDRLLASTAAEADAERRRRGTRRLWLVAAVFALIVGGPLAVLAVSGDDGDSRSQHFASPARQMYEHGEKIGTVDASTKIRATVSLEKKPWGTHVALKLGDLRGPLECELIAVGENGKKQTVTTWAVPRHGYGIKGTKWDEPLYTHGGAAFSRSDLARLEVRTLDGRRLATIDV
ncbi:MULTISPECIES: zf-HC2 domain-containing protein [unclassified Streptomyces]|uniref:zf-HC2 domain-containing protein n=1 Tax=unclassified Streptomyces TaxID=2593676 RepID=UPI002DDC6F96|nr:MULTISPECIES: zf-HC2 domain-containing protein [unclassified Streptomyces]WSA91550.1 zf-HC2 domain-containing protein [Streptomyces sp. NBC_01795]WSB75920.1 zf-HC2 domain-containing protein [Streptomyces sp. NBC_01775]WSS44643.1 zf-HC2 domain-containing protein [Streptomyces sp. NBC_01187]